MAARERRRGTKIGRGARVGLDCFVSIEVEIGDLVDLYSRSQVGLQARLEAGVAIYGARIGNLAVIGPKAEILGGASVGHGARIGAEAIVCQDAGIGVGAVIGPRADVPPDERIAENGASIAATGCCRSCFGRARRFVTAVWSARRGLRFWLGIPAPIRSTPTDSTCSSWTRSRQTATSRPSTCWTS